MFNYIHTVVLCVARVVLYVVYGLASFLMNHKWPEDEAIASNLLHLPMQTVYSGARHSRRGSDSLLVPVSCVAQLLHRVLEQPTVVVGHEGSERHC